MATIFKYEYNNILCSDNILSKITKNNISIIEYCDYNKINTENLLVNRLYSLGLSYIKKLSDSNTKLKLSDYLINDLQKMNTINKNYFIHYNKEFNSLDIYHKQIIPGYIWSNNIITKKISFFYVICPRNVPRITKTKTKYESFIDELQANVHKRGDSLSKEKIIRPQILKKTKNEKINTKNNNKFSENKRKIAELFNKIKK
jgi:hypothetical protein